MASIGPNASLQYQRATRRWLKSKLTRLRNCFCSLATNQGGAQQPWLIESNGKSSILKRGKKGSVLQVCVPKPRLSQLLIKRRTHGVISEGDSLCAELLYHGISTSTVVDESYQMVIFTWYWNNSLVSLVSLPFQFSTSLYIMLV